MKITLDLTRDLPKVRQQMDAVLTAQQGRCEYVGPCVVGAMMPERARAFMDCPGGDEEDTYITTLIKHGWVSVPKGQVRSFAALQRAFDSNSRVRFLRSLRRAERKYLAQGIEARSDTTGTGVAEGESPVGDSRCAQGGS